MSKLLSMMMSGKKQSLNATIVGNPTISSDFIVSGFSQESLISNNGNYLISNIKEDFRPKRNKLFEFVIKLKPTSLPTQDNFNCIFGYHNAFYTTVNYQCKVANKTSGGYKGSVNTWFWVKFTNYYNGEYKSDNDYVILGSIDGINYSYGSGIYSNIFKAYSPIGRIFSDTNYGGLYAFNGEIDMKETYMREDDNIIWQGVI